MIIFSLIFFNEHGSALDPWTKFWIQENDADPTEPDPALYSQYKFSLLTDLAGGDLVYGDPRGEEGLGVLRLHYWQHHAVISLVLVNRGRHLEKTR